MCCLKKGDMTMEAKIRRERETLFLSSLAVIIFCVWGSAKVLFSYILDPIHWIKYVTGSDNPAITETGAAIIIVAYIFVNFIFRLCIGLPAIKESRADASGKRVLYLIFAVIFLATDIIFYWTAFIMPIRSGHFMEMVESGEIIGPLAMLFIEVTSCFVTMQLIISSLKLKYLRRAAKEA